MTDGATSVANTAELGDVVTSDDIRNRYIDLLRDSLTMMLWRGADGNTSGRDADSHGAMMRENGRDWPKLAHSMIGAKRMNNLQFCVEDVLKHDISGDLIETGVWRGGACIFMRGILAAHGDKSRRVWVADSFEGLPKANASKYPLDALGAPFHRFRQLAVSEEQVAENFRRYGLLDDQVVFLKGFFSESLPGAPIEKLAVLRLDGDMYESTIDALVNLYSKVSDGGYIIVDDYAIEGCREAINDFRRDNGIDDLIRTVDWSGVFWQKGSGPAPATLSTDEIEHEKKVLAETFDRSPGSTPATGVRALRTEVINRIPIPVRNRLVAARRALRSIVKPQ
nr:TylF/MycF family methyltransferase [Smaragdicoccus niigatensis]